MEKVDKCGLLYQKMAAEQEKFRAWLLTQPPNVILDRACAYAIREDILMEMETLELTDAQAGGLLESRTPLADIYKAWHNTETNHMSDVRDVIDAHASAVEQTEKKKELREGR